MHGNKFWKCWTPKAIYPSNITLPLWPTWRLYRIGLFFFFFFFAYLAGWMCMHFCLPRWARFLIPDTAQNRFEFNAQMYDFRDSFNTRTHTHTHEQDESHRLDLVASHSFRSCFPSVFLQLFFSLALRFHFSLRISTFFSVLEHLKDGRQEIREFAASNICTQTHSHSYT